jgi:hypothetical protein
LFEEWEEDGFGGKVQKVKCAGFVFNTAFILEDKFPEGPSFADEFLEFFVCFGCVHGFGLLEEFVEDVHDTALWLGECAAEGEEELAEGGASAQAVDGEAFEPLLSEWCFVWVGECEQCLVGFAPLFLGTEAVGGAESKPEVFGGDGGGALVGLAAELWLVVPKGEFAECPPIDGLSRSAFTECFDDVE